MAWKRLITEDDFAGFATPTATIGGAAVNGAATTAMRSDAAPELGPLTRDLAFGGFKGTGAGDPTAAQDLATKAYVDGDNVIELASMAKFKAGRVGRDVADWCMQFQGGMGYTWDNPVSRAYRDFRLGSIGGGADEVMLTVIAKQMGLMR